MSNKQWTEAMLLEMLQNTYKESDGHCVLTHVRSDPGTSFGIRTADALSFGLWPSRGLYLTGYEVKVARNDWMKELDNPAKADAIGRRCDFWYIIAAPGIVSLEELPEGWGLMEPARTRLKIIKKAGKNENPEPMTRGFVSTILRQFLRQKSDRNTVNEARRLGYKQGYDKAQEDAIAGGDRELQHRLKNLERYEKAVADFTKMTGITIWDPRQLEEVAQAIKWTYDHGKTLFRQLERTERDVDASLKNIQQARQSLKVLETKAKQR
jgi:hypothetical protein